jgi:hypothetical protein
MLHLRRFRNTYSLHECCQALVLLVRYLLVLPLAVVGLSFCAVGASALVLAAWLKEPRQVKKPSSLESQDKT